MPRRRLPFRLTVWAFAGALLLKAAVPMLASVAAGLQGKAVAEVCALYGVALPGATQTAPVATSDGVAAGHGHHVHAANAVPAGDAAHAIDAAPAAHALHSGVAEGHGGEPRSEGGRTHAADHCVLTALVAFTSDSLDAAPPFAPAPAALRLASAREPLPAADASARWAALVGHGPPLLS